MLFAEFEKWFRKKYGIAIGDLENPLINAKSEDNSDKGDNDEIDQDALTYIKAKKKVNNKISDNNLLKLLGFGFAKSKKAREE